MDIFPARVCTLDLDLRAHVHEAMPQPAPVRRRKTTILSHPEELVAETLAWVWADASSALLTVFLELEAQHDHLVVLSMELKTRVRLGLQSLPKIGSVPRR
jgi:hypothetical protein